MMLALTALAGFAPAPAPYLRHCDTRTHYAEVSSALSASSPPALLLAELNDLMLDCHIAGWDGYGAKAVSADAYLAAKQFIESLPVGFPVPSLSADPDGCVTFEWRKSARRVVLVSVHPNFQVDYAAVFGAAKHYGSEPFFGELPESVRVLAQRVSAA